MSEPVSNAEIEDVLSSIRRLVSEDPGPKPRPAPPEPEVERLVLTPAFRVEEVQEDKTLHLGEPVSVPEDLAESVDDDPLLQGAIEPEQLMGEPQMPEVYESDEDWSETAAAAELEAATERARAAEAKGDETLRDADSDAQDAAAREAPAPAQHPAETTLEQRIAELEAAIQQTQQGWEPDGSETAITDEIDPIAEDPAANEASLAEVLMAPTPEASEPEAPAPPEASQEDLDATAALEESDAVLAALLSEDEASAQPEDDPQPEESDAQDVLTGEVLTPEAFQHSEPVIHADEVEDAEPAPSPLPEPEPESEPVVAQERVFSTAAMFEQEVENDDAVAQTEDPPEAWQDEPLADEARQSAEWADDTQDLTADDPLAEDEPLGSELLAAEDLAIDEETLRQIVADMVRQELQGVMGERITRNVRRLVRREIQKAMTMRELE